jgi:hypothetical protein
MLKCVGSRCSDLHRKLSFKEDKEKKVGCKINI